MKTKFKPIKIEEYVKLHLNSNPGTNRDDLLQRLEFAAASAKNGVRCACGNPIWIIGSAEAGLSCFTCITGEPHPDNDYEIDFNEKKS